ncbi:MAG: OmpA family protein [Phycisphaerales bacterium]|nr:OmpA family protein [Phycisphaerales bacterium]NUQ69111.1 OmpA family protein [Phycisphaerales bacterium]
MGPIGGTRRGRGLGIVALALMTGISTMLGGCSGVDKKKYDLAMQEAAELRERNAQLEQQNRDQAARLAEAEAAKQNQGDMWADAGGDIGAGGGGRGSFERGPNGTMVAKLSGDVLFDSGSATLKSTAKKTLDRIAGEIKSNYSGRAIRVEGHTDTDPIRKSKWPSNEALSEARADSVMAYLASKGISSSRMQAVGYGSSRAKSTKAASRRVEIVILAR